MNNSSIQIEKCLPATIPGAVGYSLRPKVRRVQRWLRKYTPTFCAIYDRAHGKRTRKNTDNKLSTFTISSRLLCDCYHHLNRDTAREAIVNISGYEFGHLVTMERLEAPRHMIQQAAYARTDLNDTFRILMHIEHYGGLLAGVFHIHPGNGPEAIHPSWIDIQDQQKREKVDMQCIGAIFSRDGFVRFFSVEMPFTIHVIGKGVIQHERFLYQIVEAGGVSDA